jgi:putative Holliday junction resolvase
MSAEKGRILAVDPGEKRIGLAISDPDRKLARPLEVLHHVSRVVDAATIAQAAAGQGATLILVGMALDSDGQAGPAARKAGRMAAAIGEQTAIPVRLWDESGSTQVARETRLAAGAGRQKRGGHLDDLAASIILQSYLDEIDPPTASPTKGPQEE